MSNNEDHVRKLAATRLDEALAKAHPMRPLLIGQAPGRGLDGWPVLTGAAGDVLGRFAGLNRNMRGALGLMFASERRNIFPNFPGDPSRFAAGDADPFPMSKAASKAAALLDSYAAIDCLCQRRVVLVGRLVAEAFKFDAPFFEWETAGWDGRIYWRSVIPHPSGRNRWWNDPGNTASASAFLVDLFKRSEESAAPGFSGRKGDEGPPRLGQEVA